MSKNKFYTFRQNNSGGYWVGEYKYIIVEAPSANVANAIAEDNGVYFDWCNDGRDCHCCGDRWYRTYEGNCSDTPQIYGDEIYGETGMYDSESKYLVVRMEEQHAI